MKVFISKYAPKSRKNRQKSLLNFLLINQRSSFSNVMWYYALLITIVCLICSYVFFQIKKSENQLDNPILMSIEIPLNMNSKFLNPDSVKKKIISSGLLGDSTKTSIYYRKRSSRFWNLKKNRPVEIQYRTVNKGNPILNAIFDLSNNPVGDINTYLSKQKSSVIVTRNLLDKLGLDENSPYIFVVSSSDENFPPVPIQVSAIVDVLPNRTDIVFSEYFLGIFLNYLTTSPDNIIKIDRLNPTYFYGTRGDVENYQKVFDEFLKQESLLNNEDASNYKITPREASYGFSDGVQTMVQVKNSKLLTDSVYLESLSTRLIDHCERSELDVIQTYVYGNLEPNKDQMLKRFTRNFLAFHLDRDDLKTIDHIELQKLLFNEYQLDVDYSGTTKLNFVRTISNTLKGLLIVVISIGIIFLLVHSYSVQNQYFSKMKKIVGNLKAYGVTNEEFYKVHIITLIELFIPGILIAIAASFTLLKYLQLDNKVLTVSEFLFFIGTLFSTFIIVMTIIMLILFTNFKRILKKDPGYLIYG